MKASEEQLNYGREREWRNLDRIHQYDAEIVARMHRSLERTLDECKKQAEAWYTRYADANGITPAEAKKRASEADIAALARKAKDYVARRHDTDYAFSEQANKEMALYNFAMKMNREEILMRYIDLELSAGTDERNQLLGDHLTNMSMDELKRQAGLLGLRLPDHKRLTDIARAIATSSFHGETFSDRLWKHQKSLRTLLEDGITKSMLLGKNPMTWARSLEGHLRDAESNAKFLAKRLAVSEAARVQMEAQRMSYEAAGYDKYMVICEPTACEVCMEHDAQVYPVKEFMQGVNAPKFHPFCKCSTSAYVDRRDTERAIAKLEKESGLPPEKFYNYVDEFDRRLRELGASKDIQSEIKRADKHRDNWQSYPVRQIIKDLGGKLDQAFMNEAGSKMIIPTSHKHKTIVYSPSGRYSRVWDDRFDKKDRNGYYDKKGLKGNNLIDDIKSSLNEIGRIPMPKLLDQIIKERTHFNDE